MTAERRSPSLRESWAAQSWRSAFACDVHSGPFFNDCTPINSMKLSEIQCLHIDTYIISWLHYGLALLASVLYSAPVMRVGSMYRFNFDHSTILRLALFKSGRSDCCRRWKSLSP